LQKKKKTGFVKFTNIYPTMHSCEIIQFCFMNVIPSQYIKPDCSASSKDWLQ